MVTDAEHPSSQKLFGGKVPEAQSSFVIRGRILVNVMISDYAEMTAAGAATFGCKSPRSMRPYDADSALSMYVFLTADAHSNMMILCCQHRS